MLVTLLRYVFCMLLLTFTLVFNYFAYEESGLPLSVFNMRLNEIIMFYSIFFSFIL